MYWVKRITIPANTLESDPLSETIELVPGVISRVEILFPHGCFQLARLRIYHKAHQLWPSTPGSYISGDTYPVFWSESYSLSEEPYDLEVKAWNLDDSYSHTVTISIEQSSMAIEDRISVTAPFSVLEEWGIV